MEYNLYIDYSCVLEFDNLNDAMVSFNEAVADNPDSVIDILSEDGEYSYASYDGNQM